MCYNAAKIQKVLGNRARNTDNYAQFKHLFILFAKTRLFCFQFCIRLFEVDRLTEHVYNLLLLPNAVGQTTEAERNEVTSLSLVGLDVPFRTVVTCDPLPVLRDSPADCYQSEHSVVAVNAQLLAGVIKYLCHTFLFFGFLKNLCLSSQTSIGIFIY